jgi:hypothetical protein
MQLGKALIVSVIGAFGLTLIPAGLTSSCRPRAFEARAQDNGPSSESSGGLENRLNEDKSYGPTVDPNDNANPWREQHGGLGSGSTPPSNQSAANLQNQINQAYSDYQSAQQSGDRAAMSEAYNRYTSLQAQMQQLPR